MCITIFNFQRTETRPSFVLLPNSQGLWRAAATIPWDVFRDRAQFADGIASDNSPGPPASVWRLNVFRTDFWDTVPVGAPAGGVIAASGGEVGAGQSWQRDPLDFHAWSATLRGFQVKEENAMGEAGPARA